MTTTISKPALTVWIPDPDADDLAAQLGDAFCADYHGFDLRVEGNRWSVDSVEQFISGPYPGTPDWNEYHHGDGIASSPLEARWAAMRCAERVLVSVDAEEWLMAEAIESGNPGRRSRLVEGVDGMRLALILVFLLLLATAVRLGEPALPKCPHGRTAHERCLP